MVGAANALTMAARLSQYHNGQLLAISTRLSCMGMVGLHTEKGKQGTCQRKRLLEIGFLFHKISS